MVSDGWRFTGSSGIRDYVDDAGCLRNVDGEVTLHRGGSGEHWLWDYRRVHFRRTAAIEDDEDFVGLPDDCSRKRSNVAQSYFGRRAKKIRTFFNVNIVTLQVDVLCVLHGREEGQFALQAGLY